MSSSRPFAILLTLLICWCIGCASSSGSRRQSDGRPPQWVKELPQNPDYYFARGMRGTTVFPSEGERYARDDAVLALVKTLGGVHIRQLKALFQNIRSSGIASSRMRTISEENISSPRSLLELVAVAAVMEGKWIDKSGNYSGGRQGSTYVLLKIPRSRTALKAWADMAQDEQEKEPEKVEDERDRIRAVRERSADAFAELERESDNRRQMEQEQQIAQPPAEQQEQQDPTMISSPEEDLSEAVDQQEPEEAETDNPQPQNEDDAESNEDVLRALEEAQII
jgi:hypothetical protein